MSTQESGAAPGALSVAIIGMAGRFPGAADIEAFWRNLVEGVESIRDYGEAELLAAGVTAGELRDPAYVRRGAPLEGSELFDAEFFGFSPREAEVTDPQQRLFLESAWQALEHAGYAARSFLGAIGVFGGVSGSSYFLDRILSNPALCAALPVMQLNIGNEKDFLCSGTAYRLGLRGPAVTVQTACSTSLVAVHLACQSILNGECDMALAGGAAITAFGNRGYLYSEGGIAARDGRCRPFSADASGTVVGNGVGIVVLKALDRAIEDGDCIHAVIRGSAINNDGADKVGFTAPSVNGQARAISEALAVAGVEADSISYVEAHGTGTVLGDPIEVRALTQAFAGFTDRRGFCALGSVKSNIGHLDAAAGVTGLIKTALALGRRVIPASLHFERPNPHIDFDRSPFFVNASRSDWPAPGGGPRRAGVSSFGIGGTNCHLVLEEAPQLRPAPDDGTPRLLLLSAKSREALAAAVEGLRDHLRGNPALNLADCAYTLQVGREAMPFRYATVCREAQEAVARLAAAEPRGVAAVGERPAASLFMFPGQGSQHPGMAGDLYQGEPRFRALVDQCALALREPLGFDLRQRLFPAEGAQAEAEALLRRTDVAQPALFVIEYALAKLLMALGVRPAALVGHSLGEYVAACLAGVFTLEEGLWLVAQRGRLLASLPPGAMLAVHCAPQPLTELLGEGLWIAAFNGPELCSVAGSSAAIEGLRGRLEARGIACQPLHTSHPFHSPLVEPIAAEFRDCLRRIRLRAPQIPFLSNLTGDWITPEQATDPDYWVDHLRRPVRFAESLAKLAAEGERLLLEVGPGRSLATLAGLTPGHRAVLSTLPTPRERGEAQRTLLEAIGQLWVHGVPIAWEQLHPGERRRRVPLPGYPFQRRLYAIPPARPGVQPAAAAVAEWPGKRPDKRSWFYRPSWRRAELPPAGAAAEAAGAGGHLLFADECGLAGQLAEPGSTLVQRGAHFARLREGLYQVVPGEAASCAALIAALAADRRLPRRITYCWSVSDPQSPPRGAAEQLWELLALVQGFAAAAPAAPLAWEVISNGVYPVLGNEPIAPEKAALIGICRVLPLEMPESRWRHIDIVWEPASAAQTVALLRRELALPGASATLAHRGNSRWFMTFDPIEAWGGAAALREDGHFLIVGGLGGIGFCFAQFLATRAVRPRLTLVGRSPLPAADAQGPGQERRARLEQLRALGAKVQYLAADIGVAAEAERLREAALAFGGAVHGLFHAAAAEATEPRFERKQRAGIEAFMAPKVAGAEHLAHCFESEATDFFILCSSLSSFAPTLGHLEYCAANACLDAFAQRPGGGRRLAVNFSVWQVGAALRGDEHLTAQEREQKGLYLSLGIAAEDAPELFDLLLRIGGGQVAVSPVELSLMQKGTAALNEALAGRRDGAPDAALPACGRRPDLAAPPVPARNGLERRLLKLWEEAFGIAGIGVEDNFFELGGHSLLASKVMAQVRSRVSPVVGLADLFNAPTVAGLAQRLAELGAEIETPEGGAEPAGRAEALRQRIDAMTPEQIAALVEEKRRAKAQRQAKVSDGD